MFTSSLDALDSTDLGFHIGPICVNSVCCADDMYVLSDRQSGLQGAMDIVSHYAKRYRVIFNADKTKIVVTGSKLDMTYYQDICPWFLNGEQVSVVTDNEHLGIVVSGLDEEQKKVHRQISQCRDSLFSLLGPALSYKCKLSPVVQLHLWKTYSLPVLCSGLSALPIRPTTMKPLQVFQHKILRGFLKLGPTSPVPGLFFLLGELPIEATLHCNLLALFHSIWVNPQTKIFEMAAYIMKMADDLSTTWSYHVRLICLKYSLPDPLRLLEQPPMSKQAWKTLVRNRITVFHEKQQRHLALNNSRLTYFNVQILGLSGLPHPVIRFISETRSAMKMRAHLKLLTGDFLSYERLASDRGGSPHCRLCLASVETTQHILLECSATAETRQRLFPELLNLIASIQPNSSLLNNRTPNSIITQFILDPTAMNLQNGYRISNIHPNLKEVICLSRDWCYAVTRLRHKLLQEL